MAITKVADRQLLTTPASGGGNIRVITNISGGDVDADSSLNIDYVYYISDGSQITLPTAVGNTNRYTIMRTGSSIVPIETTLSQTINGEVSPLNLDLKYASVDLMSNGSDWFIH